MSQPSFKLCDLIVFNRCNIFNGVCSRVYLLKSLLKDVLVVSKLGLPMNAAGKILQGCMGENISSLLDFYKN